MMAEAEVPSGLALPCVARSSAEVGLLAGQLLHGGSRAFVKEGVHLVAGLSEVPPGPYVPDDAGAFSERCRTLKITRSKSKRRGNEEVRL